MYGLLISCAAAAPSVSAPTAPTAASAFPEEPGRLARYHSKRLALSLPLPGGTEWRVDDHSGPELVATHAPSHSRVAVGVFRTETLVGRQQCEKLARERKLVPSGELRTLEDDAAITQNTFDTRVWVAVAPGGGADQPLVGHVMAFGGFLRKCYAFHFSTQVGGAEDERALSSRLAYARARILGGLELDPFGEVPRERP
jgi:hypothetical protein